MTKINNISTLSRKMKWNEWIQLGHKLPGTVCCVTTTDTHTKSIGTETNNVKSREEWIPGNSHQLCGAMCVWESWELWFDDFLLVFFLLLCFFNIGEESIKHVLRMRWRPLTFLLGLMGWVGWKMPLGPWSITILPLLFCVFCVNEVCYSKTRDYNKISNLNRKLVDQKKKKS